MPTLLAIVSLAPMGTPSSCPLQASAVADVIFWLVPRATTGRVMPLPTYLTSLSHCTSRHASSTTTTTRRHHAPTAVLSALLKNRGTNDYKGNGLTKRGGPVSFLVRFGRLDGQFEHEAGAGASVGGVEHEVATKTTGNVAGYGESDALSVEELVQLHVRLENLLCVVSLNA